MTSKVLVVLGNGYDIAWGYPTQYGSFYQYSKELRNLANRGNQLCQYIIETYLNDSLWSDLEMGLYKYSCGLTKQYGEGNAAVADIFKKEFNELRWALFSYLDTISGDPKDASRQTPIMGLNVEWKEALPQYLTFNYSVITFGSAAGADRSFLDVADNIKTERFVYQHGSIYNTSKNCKNPPEQLVLGIDEGTQKVEKLHSFLYKSYQNVHNLHETLQTIDEKQLYVIYGCSIGDSDAMYFKKIFNQKEKEYLIYYFDDSALSNLKNKIGDLTGSFAEFEANNSVTFLGVKDVERTREETRKIMQEYKRSDGTYFNDGLST